MPVTLNELLQPQVITDTISKLSTKKGTYLTRLFGMQLGGGNKKEVPTRYASFRVNNHVREPMSGRAPGTGPAVIAPNPMGEQRVAMARFHEKMILDYEQLGNLSPIVGPNAQIDEGGQDYIAKQIEHQVDKGNASLDVLVAGLIRGALYLAQSGDNWVPYLTSQGGTEITVDFQIPAANKTQLNMLAAGNIIGTSWDNPAAPIVKNILKVNEAFINLNGMPFRNLLVDSTVFGHIITNTEVRNVGGTVQSPFDSFTYDQARDVDGNVMAGKMTAKLRAVPWLDIHIIDDVLSIGGTDPVYSTGTGTLTKVVPATVGVFLPPIEKSWVQMWHGGEYISEDVGKPAAMKKGFQMWKSHGIEPTTISLLALLNALPCLYREKAIAYGTVVF